MVWISWFLLLTSDWLVSSGLLKLFIGAVNVPGLFACTKVEMSALLFINWNIHSMLSNLCTLSTIYKVKCINRSYIPVFDLFVESYVTCSCCIGKAEFVPIFVHKIFSILFHNPHFLFQTHGWVKLHYFLKIE